MNDWPFKDARNTAVFTIRQIACDGKPILHVTHDAEDGVWQFLGLESPSQDDAMILALEEVVKLDPSVKELADLPVGWEAIRPDKNRPWTRIQM